MNPQPVTHVSRAEWWHALGVALFVIAALLVIVTVLIPDPCDEQAQSVTTPITTSVEVCK